jgi:hypothetical protein
MPRPDDAAQLVAEVHGLTGRLTAAVAELHGTVINHCLSTETLILDARGFASRDWTVPFGSLAVHNAGAATLTVTNATPASAAPTSGLGVVLFPSGSAASANLSGRTLSFYGAPGAALILSVFTKPQPPAWGTPGSVVFTL